MELENPLSVQVAYMNRKIQELENEVARLKQENIQRLECTLVDDKYISNTYATLQGAIKELVTKWFRTDVYPSEIANLTGQAAQVFEGWHSGLGKKNKMIRMRGMIFGLLFDGMLDVPGYAFALEAPEIESGLARFESRMTKFTSAHIECMASYTAWRKETMLWARRLDPSMNFTSENCPTTVRSIVGLLSLFSGTPENLRLNYQRGGPVYNDVLKLYNLFSMFTLSLRLLPDTYKFSIPKGEVKSSDLDRIQIVGSERSDPYFTLPSPVAFTISGSLIKYSGQDSSAVAVINKARVFLGE